MSIVEAVSYRLSCMLQERRLKNKKKANLVLQFAAWLVFRCNVLHTLLLGKMVDKVLFLGNG